MESCEVLENLRMNWGLSISLIFEVDSQDNKKHGQLYGIEFGQVKILKLILAQRIFWISWFEGLLWKWGLGCEVMKFISMQFLPWRENWLPWQDSHKFKSEKSWSHSYFLPLHPWESKSNARLILFNFHLFYWKR